MSTDSTRQFRRQWTRLKKRAAYAPKGAKNKRLAELRAFVTSQLIQEIGGAAR